MSSFPPAAPLNKSSQPSAPPAGFSSSHPSLPARPTAPLPSYQPHPSASSAQSSSGRGFNSALAFKPPSVAAKSSNSWQQTYAPTVSAGPTPPSSYSGGQPASYGTQQAQFNNQPQYYPQQQSLNYYQQPQAPPQLQNPFPVPGQEGPGRGRGRIDDYDPELEAQIAQWQSAYVPKDDASKSGFNRTIDNPNVAPLGSRAGAANIDVGATTTPGSGVAAVVAGTDGKQKTVLRSGGGKSWQDPSLLEWDPSHPRLFIGNLAGEVTDDSLLKAFARYESVQKARVVRDKRTSKSKGYGFVSFSNSDDYFQAAKEMQGKYIGSHPVLIKRSTTEIKAVAPDHKKGKHGKGGHSGGGGGNMGKVQKKPPKKKGGLKILG